MLVAAAAQLVILLALIAPVHATPSELSGWFERVRSECSGFRIISAHRPGDTWGLHRENKAIDIAGGNYDCAYRVLREFPGGMSIDAHNPRINHIHLSWNPGGKEWGARFNHPVFQGGIGNARN
jgi:hypothetical protein